MKKFNPVRLLIWLLPAISTAAIVVLWLLIAFYPPKGEYAGLGYLIFGTIGLFIVLPLIISWIMSKYTRLFILPALLNTAMTALPFRSFLHIAFFDGDLYYEKKAATVILISVLVWNLICFAIMRLVRHVQARRKEDKECSTRQNFRWGKKC